MAKIYKTEELKKIIFLGTPEFAVPSLEKLALTKYRPSLVITQPDKPKGRKQVLQAPPVKISSLELGLPVYQPSNINSEDSLAKIRDEYPDLLITVAYGGFLGKSIRKIAPLGCINLHPSLLPKLRGASPLQSTLFNNETRSGLTIFKIIAKMDAGPIIKQEALNIPTDMNYSEYSKYAADQGAEFLIKTLEDIEKRGIELIDQNHEEATFTEKIDKESLLINWKSTCTQIIGKIRGLSYQPGARTLRSDQVIQILRAIKYSESTNYEAGTITHIIKNEGFVVACQDGEVLVTEVKPEGKKLMSAHSYNLGAQLKLYEKLG
ncbi:methionyl-tRNA formyltransferase [bacterium]|nr:methionyl-tRNA formyltransferase [bacterium]